MKVAVCVCVCVFKCHGKKGWLVAMTKRSLNFVGHSALCVGAHGRCWAIVEPYLVCVINR